jgi:NTE family protein
MPSKTETSSSTLSVNLALQGGGSHGAFTWGALDGLLEHGQLDFDGISGTSAGAMNAVVFANGWLQASDAGRDPREGARECLAGFWNGIADMNSLNPMQRAPFDIISGAWKFSMTPTNMFAETMRHMLSPYQSNPLDINPLRMFLDKHVDFGRLQKQRTFKLYVCATEVRSGKAEIFSGNRVTLDSVMASACLPAIFKAVQIEGIDYWDGGYSANPPIQPLISNCSTQDVLLIQVNPLHTPVTPSTAHDITDRTNELTFNAPLMAEMRTIDFINQLIEAGRMEGTKFKTIRMHRIDGGERMEQLSAGSKLATDGMFLKTLREMGRDSAKKWLEKNYAKVGDSSSVKLGKDYLGDMKIA